MNKAILDLGLVLCYTLLVVLCCILYVVDHNSDIPYGKIGCGLVIAPLIILILMIIAESC